MLRVVIIGLSWSQYSGYIPCKRRKRQLMFGECLVLKICPE